MTVDDVREALDGCRPTLVRAARLAREELLAECTRLAVLPPAVAAIDMALWDLEGRRTDQPVWRLLGARAAPPVEVNYTVAAADRAGAAAQASHAKAAGFHTVKAKVGIGDDAGRLAAVRAVLGPDVAIRIDANGAWSIAEAEATLRALAPIGIELCEEPVRGLAQTRELAAATNVPLALDETAAAIGALEERVCDAVCLKIAQLRRHHRAGRRGSPGARRRLRRVPRLDPRRAARDRRSAARGGGHPPRRACGLATLALFADREDPLPARGGRIDAPTGAGLGDGLVSWYRAG